MSDSDRERRNRPFTHEVGRRVSTADEAGGGAHAHSPVAANEGWTSGLAKTRAERVAETLDLARLQLAAIDAVTKGSEQRRAAEVSLQLRETLNSLEHLLAQAGDDVQVRRLRAEAAQIIANGDARITEIQARQQSNRQAAIAEQAIESGGVPLPHLAQIQASFGRHDVSDVRAHVGGRAGDANRELGAHAFTSNNQIAFATQPGLHLAAHEAAHVVQQRHGVALDGAMDKPGDEYERHADLVANAVLRGESAEPLLDQVRGGGSTASVVQRKVEGGAQPQAETHNLGDAARSGMKAALDASKPDVAWAYLRKNENKFLESIETSLVGLHPPTDSRINWQPGGLSIGFRGALAKALGGSPLFIKLPDLMQPADPWYMIDQNRPLAEGTPGVSVDGKEPIGPLAWVDLAGTALATIVYKALSDSLRRMVPRFALQIDWKAPEPVVIEDLVMSHPMDRVTVNLLLDPAVVKTVPGKNSKPAAKKHEGPDDRKEFKYGVRFLNDWRWLGDVDPNLWNYVEAKDPKDATPEDVAASLWASLEGTQYAYAIRQSGPYFRVDPPFARKFTQDPKHEIDDKHKDNVLDLADSSLATDAATAQAADERHLDKHHHVVPPDLKKLGETLEKSQRQLERVKSYFATPKLYTLVMPALKWVTKYRDGLLGLPDERLSALTPVIEGQSEVLFEATGAITELSGMGDPTALQNAENPVFDTMREYAIVCGESHLIDSAREHLQIARQSKAQLPIALLEMSARDTGVTVNELAQGRNDPSPTMDDRKRNLQIDNYRIASLRAQQAMGQEVNPDVVANVAASLKEQAVDSRVESLYDEIGALRNLAADSESGFFETLATAFDSDIRALPGLLTSALTDLIQTVQEPHRRNKEEQMKAAGSNLSAQTQALNDVARLTERNLKAFIERHDLSRRMKIAMGIIEKQQIRTAVVRIVTQILILIATSVAAGAIGNVVAGAVRGAMVADAATASIGMLRTARVVGGLAGMTVDAGINAGVQVAVQGGDAKEAFVSNFLGAAALRAALTPLTKAAQAWGAMRGEAEAVEAVGKWQKIGNATKFVVKQGAVLTTAMITGAATDYVVHRIYHSKEPPTEKQAVDWAVQGGSMAIGIFVGHWTHDFEGRAVKAAEEFGYKTVRERVFNVRKLASEVSPGGARAGDSDAALELLIERHEALQEERRVIDEATKASKGTPSTLLETMRRGNAADQAVVKDAAFAQVPLRLAGLEPDDASGRIWAGATEDIAIALHQAERAGLNVEVLSHDTAARQWKVLYNNDEITIVETKAEGRPRAAKGEVTTADRVHAQRYAESAAFMQEKWEAKVKRDIDRQEVIEVDHLQLGYAYAGVVNQSTLPAQGQGLDNKLIVYKHKGTLSGRGEQELGQPATKFDAPGVRATEQSPKDAPLIKSNELDRSLDIGRIENQTPAYRGEAVALQTPDKATLDDPWKAANRKFRIKIRDFDGAERWFYTNGFDNVGGLGPGSTKELEKVVIDETLRNSMMAGEQPMLLLGDDPDYTHKVKAGDILIWGGTPTGAWAAEPVKANPHSQATVLGDTRPPADWAKLFDEYNDLKESIAVMSEQAPAELKNRVAAIEAMITDAHNGAKIPRNRKPGATYEKPLRGERGPKDVRIEFGTPSQIKPTGDGRVLVTVGTGENARTRVYDQVVLAHGQDPAKGPAALLGKGAESEPTADPKQKAYGYVPQGTIALKPIWGPKNDQGRRPILGLESVDPPGIVLKGAAYASKKMSPWVAKNERVAFEHEVEAMSSETAVTRDYGAVSPDSYGVSPGMEVQRDRIPRANEVLNAGRLTLPGPDKTLELGADESTWDDKVREFFAINLKASDHWIKVKRLGGGATQAVVYHVSVDGTEVGIFKLFDRRGSAVNEQRTLDMLQAAKLETMTVVKGRSTVKVDPQTGYGDAILMDVARGTTVKEMVQSLPSDHRQRIKSLQTLRSAVQKVAEGLAEMHVKFGDNSTRKPEMMSESAKKSDADYFLGKAFRPGGRDYDKVRVALGDDFDHVRSVAEGRMYQDFLSAEVPATAYHGDANAGNFALSGNNNSDLSMFDVDKMQYSLPDHALEGNLAGIKGNKTGAADMARFLNSLETLAPGKLAPDELHGLQEAFKERYFKKYLVGSDKHRVARTEYEKAARWYELEMELAIVVRDPAAKERILRLVGPKGGS